MTLDQFAPEPIDGLPSRDGKRWYCVASPTATVGRVCLHVLAPDENRARTFAGHPGSWVRAERCRLTNVPLPLE